MFLGPLHLRFLRLETLLSLTFADLHPHLSPPSRGLPGPSHMRLPRPSDPLWPMSASTSRSDCLFVCCWFPRVPASSMRAGVSFACGSRSTALSPVSPCSLALTVKESRSRQEVQGGWVPPGLPDAVPALEAAGGRGGAGERGGEDWQMEWAEGSHHDKDRDGGGSWRGLSRVGSPHSGLGTK